MNNNIMGMSGSNMNMGNMNSLTSSSYSIIPPPPQINQPFPPMSPSSASPTPLSSSSPNYFSLLPSTIQPPSNQQAVNSNQAPSYHPNTIMVIPSPKLPPLISSPVPYTLDGLQIHKRVNGGNGSAPSSGGGNGVGVNNSNGSSIPSPSPLSFSSTTQLSGNGGEIDNNINNSGGGGDQGNENNINNTVPSPGTSESEGSPGPSDNASPVCDITRSPTSPSFGRISTGRERKVSQAQSRSISSSSSVEDDHSSSLSNEGNIVAMATSLSRSSNPPALNAQPSSGGVSGLMIVGTSIAPLIAKNHMNRMGVGGGGNNGVGWLDGMEGSDQVNSLRNNVSPGNGHGNVKEGVIRHDIDVDNISYGMNNGLNDMSNPGSMFPSDSSLDPYNNINNHQSTHYLSIQSSSFQTSPAPQPGISSSLLDEDFPSLSSISSSGGGTTGTSSRNKKDKDIKTGGGGTNGNGASGGGGGGGGGGGHAGASGHGINNQGGLVNNEKNAKERGELGKHFNNQSGGDGVIDNAGMNMGNVNFSSNNQGNDLNRYSSSIVSPSAQYSKVPLNLNGGNNNPQSPSLIGSPGISRGNIHHYSFIPSPVNNIPPPSQQQQQQQQLQNNNPPSLTSPSLPSMTLPLGSFSPMTSYPFGPPPQQQSQGQQGSGRNNNSNSGNNRIQHPPVANNQQNQNNNMIMPNINTQIRFPPPGPPYSIPPYQQQRIQGPDNNALIPFPFPPPPPHPNTSNTPSLFPPPQGGAYGPGVRGPPPPQHMMGGMMGSSMGNGMVGGGGGMMGGNNGPLMNNGMMGGNSGLMNSVMMGGGSNNLMNNQMMSSGTMNNGMMGGGNGAPPLNSQMMSSNQQMNNQMMGGGNNGPMNNQMMGGGMHGGVSPNRMGGGGVPSYSQSNSGSIAPHFSPMNSQMGLNSLGMYGYLPSGPPPPSFINTSFQQQHIQMQKQNMGVPMYMMGPVSGSSMDEVDCYDYDDVPV
jgi:hypothetical protein